MAVVLDLAEAQRTHALDGAVCVIGVFDGLHRGHRLIIADAIRDARERGARCVILTFDVDPDELFAAERLRKLMSNEDRIAALANTGVDAVVVMPFDEEFARQAPETFLAAVLGERGPASIHVGEDFRFGAKAAGTVEDLCAWAAEHSAQIRAHELLEEEGAPITATRIRGLLDAGDVQGASDLLGSPINAS